MFLRHAVTKIGHRGFLAAATPRVIVVRHHRVSVSTLTVIAPAQKQQQQQQQQNLSNNSVALLAVAAALTSMVIADDKTFNHCQVPCGIFDDPAMVNEAKQAATTIRKAMVQSQTLWTDDKKGIQTMNQVVRWINTKEEHCDKIIHIMADYCLCQRVKRESFSSDADYLRALQIHHTVMQAAMKAKQTMDISACDALDHALSHLEKLYTY